MARDEFLDGYYRWESESLRASIVASIKETRSLERNALIATGAVWTWLSTAAIGAKVPLAWWIPALFAVFGWLRTDALLRSIRRSATYIIRLERHLCAEVGPKGWERHLHSTRKREGAGDEDRGHIVRGTIDAFWAVLLAITVVAPFFMATWP